VTAPFFGFVLLAKQVRQQGSWRVISAILSTICRGGTHTTSGCVQPGYPRVKYGEPQDDSGHFSPIADILQEVTGFCHLDFAPKSYWLLSPWKLLVFVTLILLPKPLPRRCFHNLFNGSGWSKDAMEKINQAHPNQAQAACRSLETNARFR